MMSFLAVQPYFFPFPKQIFPIFCPYFSHFFVYLYAETILRIAFIYRCVVHASALLGEEPQEEGENMVRRHHNLWNKLKRIKNINNNVRL